MCRRNLARGLLSRKRLRSRVDSQSGSAMVEISTFLQTNDRNQERRLHAKSGPELCVA